MIKQEIEVYKMERGPAILSSLVVNVKLSICSVVKLLGWCVSLGLASGYFRRLLFPR